MSLEPEAEPTQAESDDPVTPIARDLSDAIADLPEYEAFLEAKERVEADEAAQAQIQEFEQVRDEYLTARETGQATQDDLRALQQAQEELHDIPVMSDFLQAQNDLELRLQAVNEEISAGLAVDFGEKAGGCCQD
jgi:cell fate (sporulation/competence/biofilm development) regulator YlbF (YheA/YmcA/DUF963 family)